MAIEKTVGVIESLNERIKLAEEDIASAAADLRAARVKNGVRSTMAMAAKIGKYTPTVLGTIFVLLGGGIFVFALTGFVRVSDSSVFLFFVGFSMLGGFLALLIAHYLPKPARPTLVDTTDFEDRLESLSKRRDDLVREKRELLLRSEQEIKEETAQRTAGHHETDSVEYESTVLTKVCPMCAETVKAQARICRFCRHSFDEAES